MRVYEGSLGFAFPSFKAGAPQMPFIKNDHIQGENFVYVGFQNSRKSLNGKSHEFVGFFTSDERNERVANNPWKYFEWFKQYAGVLSLDLSNYLDMTYEERWLNTYKSRAIGALMQSASITVVPTISWSDEPSHDYSFKGVERGSVVAVSTLGTRLRGCQKLFMAGYSSLIDEIAPPLVICYDNPYSCMFDYVPLITIEHEGRAASEFSASRYRQGQMSLF